MLNICVSQTPSSVREASLAMLACESNERLYDSRHDILVLTSVCLVSRWSEACRRDMRLVVGKGHGIDTLNSNAIHIVLLRWHPQSSRLVAESPAMTILTVNSSTVRGRTIVQYI